MSISRKRNWLLSVLLLMSVAVTGCGKETVPAGTEPDGTATALDTTEATTEIVIPTRPAGYREILDELPAACDKVENPGTREHFSFVENGTQYIFTETNTLWLYNQSMIRTCKTEFMLNVKGYKVVLAIPEESEFQGVDLGTYEVVYSDDVVNIYRQTNDSEVEEKEPMYLTLYDMTYQVTNWQELVNERVISLNNLYTSLAQMGTAIVPAEEGETLTDVITAMRTNPVLDEYCLAFREGIDYSGFIFCSPNSSNANYEDVCILMSIVVPEWQESATVHIQQIPDYKDRLEDTGKTFGEYPIMVDYTGELKYFILGEDGTCMYLEGVPGGVNGEAKSYTAREAAYVFELILTSE